MVGLLAISAIWMVFILIGLQNDSNARGRENKDSIQAVRETLRLIQYQTSPEGRAATDKQIDNIIFKADCNNRKAIQDVIEDLIYRGALPAGSNLPTIDAKCDALTSGPG